MLATFSLKMGQGCGAPPPFWLGLCYFSLFGSSWPTLSPIWARFWKVWASILKVFGVHFGGFWSRFASHVACNFGTFLRCSFLKLPLVLCGAGLVGLREAQRIDLYDYMFNKHIYKTYVDPIYQLWDPSRSMKKGSGASDTPV